MNILEWLGKDNKIGADIWEKKYQFNNETLDDFFNRVSFGNEDLKRLIKQKKFLFGGRTLANLYTYNGADISNCFSEGYVEDSLEGIMDMAKTIALTYKAQGGEGISLSKIRPKGSMTSGGFVTDGIIPFMEIFNTVTQSVSQGNSRRGALMMSLDIWHKEAKDFIKIKTKNNKIESANLSLEIDDEFMEYIKHYIETGEKINVNRVFQHSSGIEEYIVCPADLWDLICESAKDWGEPGVIFTGRFRNYNIMELIDDYNIITSNPCGEQPLIPHASCNLSSSNVAEYVIDPYTNHAKFDFESLDRDIPIIVKAMDDVLDYGIKYHAHNSQKQTASDYRNIGIGIMGLGSLFIKMGIKYGSPKSKELSDKIMSEIFRNSVIASSKLAIERGSFPKYQDSVWESEIIKNHFTQEEIKLLRANGLRNCSLLSIAPTGSLGTMLGVTTGCEPAFRISYIRTTKSLHRDKEKKYEILIKEAKEYKEINKDSELPDFFISANDIQWKDRIDIQAILQNHIDTAISSTLNLPEKTNKETISKIYLYGWEKGLKGMTVFVDKCKRAGILSENLNPEPKINQNNGFARGIIEEIPEDLTYIKYKLKTGCGVMYLFVGYDEDEGKIYDIFTNTGSGGGCYVNTEANSRLISACIRGGVPIEYVIEQLNKTHPCGSYQFKRGAGNKLSSGKSCPSSIAHVLSLLLKEIKDKTHEEIDENEFEKTIISKAEFEKIKCPECGEGVIHESGCISCMECGWSKCG